MLAQKRTAIATTSGWVTSAKFPKSCCALSRKLSTFYGFISSSFANPTFDTLKALLLSLRSSQLFRRVLSALNLGDVCYLAWIHLSTHMPLYLIYLDPFGSDRPYAPAMLALGLVANSAAAG